MAETELQPVRRGWSWGGEDFKPRSREEELGGRLPAKLRRETAEASAGRVIAEKFKRLGRP